MTSKIFAPALLSLIATAALVACGGGGSGTTATTPATTPVAAVDVVADGSAAVATNIGATVIAGASSDEEVYNMAADIGDSWQLVLNNKTSQYVIKVLKSQYNLTTSTPATFTKTTVGTVTTVKDASGSAMSVQIDTRTKSVAGNVTVGGRAASVSGSGYAIADASKLAGTYFFAGSTRNIDGQFRDTPLGSFIIAANGTDITVCDRGIVVNGACAVVPSSGRTTVATKSLKISKDSAGLLRITDGTKDFGILNVSAGDRGPVLVIDRFGPNDDIPAILRTGVFFAAKSAKLAGSEFNGTWTCSNSGSDFATLTVSGTTYSIASKSATNQGTLQYNKVVNNLNVAIDLDGVLIAKNNTEQLADSVLVLPLSSSVVVVVESSRSLLNICRKGS